MARVDFIVDGFNLFHSLDLTRREKGQDPRTRWLNLRRFLASYLQVLGKEARMGRVFYFSAFANHLAETHEGIIERHRDYIDALKSTGVIVRMGVFMGGDRLCIHCKQPVARWEEKKTDVAMGVQILRSTVKDEADVVVVVSGDTDLVPAIQSASEMCPTKEIVCMFPYRRKNKELEGLVSRSIKVAGRVYSQHQLPDEVVLDSGRVLNKPEAW